MTEEMNTCGNCGEEYEPYLVFLKKDFMTLVEFYSLKDEYDGLCQECREELMEFHEYATGSMPDA